MPTLRTGLRSDTPLTPRARFGRHGMWAGVAALAVALVACGGTPPHNAASSGLPSGSGATAAAPPTVSPTTQETGSAARTPLPDPGTLPQTRALPTASGTSFDAGVRALWTAVVTDNPGQGLPFFFPLSAYRQVKAISAPTRDWKDRLVATYALDIRAVHGSLGSGGQRARLVGVDVPTRQARWIEPSVEYNKIGYYRVYGTRVHYTLDGRARSFGICSLISWRGEWYAVHLGPVQRASRIGELCAPPG